jgi:hypothetical protein
MKTRNTLPAIALLTLAVNGCASVTEPDQVVCTLIAVSSLNVTVRDPVTSQRICDATVVAVLDGVSYELRRSGPAESCTYAGPEERAGVFEVRASKPGYEPATIGGVRVNRDECHVIPVQVSLDLRPVP